MLAPPPARMLQFGKPPSRRSKDGSRTFRFAAMVSSPSLKRRWSIRLAVVVAALLAALVAAELGVRAWRAVQGRAYSPSAMKAQGESLLQPMLGNAVAVGEHTELRLERDATISHPYYGWEEDVHQYRWIDWQLGEARVQPLARFRVALVGGSVAAGFGTYCTETFETRVAASQPALGKPVALSNHAHGGFKQPQQLNVVTFLLSLGYRPDLVINLDGFNELALGLQNWEAGTCEVFPAKFAWAPFGSSRVGDREYLAFAASMSGLTTRASDLLYGVVAAGAHRSALVGELTLQRLRSLRAAWQNDWDGIHAYLAESEGNEAWRGPKPATSEAESLRRCVENWRDSSITLDAACRAHGIAYLHALQPTMHDRGSKPVHPDEKDLDEVGEVWRRAVEQGYPLLRQEARELQRRGVRFLDLTDCFQDRSDPLYEDGLHFGQQGHELLAERMAPVVAEILYERLSPSEER